MNNNGNGNPGTKKLASTIKRQIMTETDSPLIIDYGEILPDYSLKTNTYPIPIPVGDWLVLELMTFDRRQPMTKTYPNQGEHTQPDAGYGGVHVHDVLLPGKLYWVQPGDRVIVLWIGSDANVIGRYVDSRKLMT